MSRKDKMFYIINKSKIVNIVKWYSKRIDLCLQHVRPQGKAEWFLMYRRAGERARAPYLATAALLSMAESWNLLEQPMIFLQQKARYPLSVLLSRLPEAEPAQKLFAGLLFLLPLLALFGWLCLGGGDASHEKNKLPADR